MSSEGRSLGELAQLVDAELLGDETLEIRGVAPIDAAGSGDITFLANPKYLAALHRCAASAVIVAPGVECGDIPALVTTNPYLAFAKILTTFHVSEEPAKGILPGALVDESAIVGPDVTLHPGCFVGPGVRIGRGTVIHPGVVLYAGAQIGEDALLHANAVVREDCVLGDRVILQPGAVIGSDGFGYAPDDEEYYKIPQVGIVILEEDVEIGAGSCIDRGTMRETRIARGTKIDNLVQIGHNVSVGEHSILVAQTGISGSTKIGRRCTFGGQSAAAGHLRIGDNVTVGGRGGVTNHLESNQVVSGVPAIPHRDWLKASMSFTKLPDFRRELKDLQKKMGALEALLKERNKDGSQ